jgi:vitamin B12 transporter
MPPVFRPAGAGSRTFFLALALAAIFPLVSQERSGDEERLYEDDEPLFIEEEGITVTGTRETSQQMAVVDRAEIERRGASDLAELLKESLGLGLTRYGGYGNQTSVNMRGFDSERIAFLVDGVPVNSAMDGEFDINQIDLGSVERVEVIYGGSDTKYNVSGALGGVINIVTMKKQMPGLRIGAGLSNTSAMPGKHRDRNGKTGDPHWEDLLDTQNTSFSAAWGGKSFSVSANAFLNRAENHFLFEDHLNYVRRKDNNEVWDAGASLSMAKELPDLTKLLVSSNVYYGDKHIPTSGFSDVFGKQRDGSFRQNFMLDMPRAFHDSLAAEASLSWYLTSREYAPPGATDSRHNQHSLSAINRWSWYSGDRLTLRSGFDYRFIFLDSTDMGSRNRHDGGVYLTAEFNPLERLLVIPSIKAVMSGGGIVPVPKLGFVWNAADFFTLKNNYFRSFKFPDFEDLYWSGGGGYGNPDLRPEDGWGGDLGAVIRIKKLARVESVFFTQWTADSIHWANSGGGIWKPQNVGEAVFFGLDNRVRVEIPVAAGPFKKIIPSLSYQYMLSYLLSYGYTYASEKRIPYMPAHTIAGSLDIPWATGSLLISARYESLRYADTANITGLEPSFLLNATLNQRFGKYLSTYGTLRNILNKSYESFADYPMPGLTLTLGMRVQFEDNQKGAQGE